MLRLPVPSKRIAVLCSGGLDSSVVAAEYAALGCEVYPVYVACGLRWETQERRALEEFCAAANITSLHHPVVLDLPVADLYGRHWSTATDEPVPGAQTEAAAVLLPGRNLILLAKAAVWCALHSVPTLVVAPLAGNPFPDATDQFFRLFEQAARTAMGRSLFILCPVRDLEKSEIVRAGARWPLHLTMSCINPQDELHCGVCNKCEERRAAFRAAGVPDPTRYAQP